MECTANNLPAQEERDAWDQAVVRGIGTKAARIQSYSIVAAHNNTKVEVRQHVRGEAKARARFVVLETQGLADVPAIVADMIADV